MKSKIEIFLSKVNFIIFSGFIIIVAMSFLFFKAKYVFDDSPHFTNYNTMDILFLILCIILATLFVKNINFIEKKLCLKICIPLFIIAGLFFVVLVPLKPFSDMLEIYNGAISFSNFDINGILNSEYLQTFKVNINLSLLYGIIFMIFPKSIITLKLINILLVLATAYFAKECVANLGLRYEKITFLFVLTFIPAFMYLNHIYFDNIFTLLSVLTFYLYTKNKDNIIWIFIILGFAATLRNNAFVFLIAYAIDYFFIVTKENLLLKKLAVSLACFFAIFFMVSSINKNLFYNDKIPSYPIWNLFYIGINEAEFGFMDNSFDHERSMKDILDRIDEYGPQKIANIFIKKLCWTWGEGTYQASRYSFGENSNKTESKFYYQTPITKYLMNDSQLIRTSIDSACRAQYIVLFILMVIFVLKTKEKRIFRVPYFLFVGTMLVLLIYEMKSRYIFYLYPFMIIFSVQGMAKVSCGLSSIKIKYEEKRNGINYK